MINVDLPWNPAVLEQRISRAHRMGQKRPVQVYLLITEETIEESLLQTLAAELALAERKQKISAAGGQLLGAAFGFLGELLPRGEETESMRRIAEGLRSRLSECLETSDDGQLKMTVTLPDASALDNLARSLAHLLTPR